MRLKHLLLVSFYLMTMNVVIGQCTNCQLTITCPNSGTYNLTAGTTVCLTGSGSFTGQLNNFSGNTLCIGTGITYNPSSAPSYNGNWTINNYGTIQNTANLYFNAGTSFHNYPTGSISLTSLNLNSGLGFINEGYMYATSISINSGANVTLGGNTTINGSMTNNGNLTVIGSLSAAQITNNNGATIIGGSSTSCNYIVATNGTFINNGTIGGTNSQPIIVGNSGLTLSTNATYGSFNAPTTQPTNLILNASGTTINGSFTKASTSPSGYLILRSIADTAPAAPTLTNMSTYTVGQVVGSWTVAAINNGVNAVTFSDVIGLTCTKINYLVYSFNGSSNCDKFYTTTPLANTYNPATAAPTASAQSFCSGATVANLTATGTAISWYAASTGGTPLTTTTALSTGSYYASQTVNSCESTRTSVTVTVNTTAAPTASSQTLCSASTVANLTATGTAIKWYSAATGGTALATSTALISGTTYYASQTLNSCESATRASSLVTITTTAAPTASAQTFCNTATVANLTATGTATKWYVAATGGTALTTSTTLASGTYYVSQTLNNCESTRTSVTVTVTVSNAPTASAQSFCVGATVANLTATGTAIKWYSASTGGTALATSTALASGNYYASQTISTCESARTLVVVTVNTTAAPTASSQTFCIGATVANLTAMGQSINWYAASTGGTALASSTALTSGNYYASQTLNTCESTRTLVAVTVNTTSAPSAAPQNLCNGSTVANLIATGTAVNWYTTLTGGTALATSTVLSNGTYYASQTVNGCESTRTAAAINIIVTAQPTATATQGFCTGATIANLSATGSNIKWYTTLTGGTALTTTTALTTATTYYASQTVTSCESTRTAVNVTVSTVVAPTATAQSFCNGATIANLTATGTAISWYNVGTGGSVLATSTALSSGTYYATQTIASCEGPRTSVAVTINITAAPTATASQVFCNGSEVENLNATGTAIKWYNVATGGTALSISTDLATGTYYATQTLNSCESTRTAVNVTINTTATPTASSQTFCNGATVANLTATGTSIRWYATAGSVNQLTNNTVLTTGIYYATQTLSSCESNKISVSVTVNTTAAPTATAQSFCNSAMVANLTATGTAIKWYNVATGGTALVNTTSLVNGTTYYASQTVNTCESSRTAVLVTIGATPAPTAAASQTYCANSTVANLVANGTAIKWYVTSGGASLAASTALVNGTTYYATQTLNSCESLRTPVVVSVTAVTAAPTATAQSFCTASTVANLTATGTAINWYSSATGGAALSPSTAIASGTYYATQTLNSCESATTAVAVSVTISNGGTVLGSSSFCPTAVTSTTLTLTGKSGNVLKWQSSTTSDFSSAVTDIANTSTTLVASSVSNTTYYRALVQNGTCPVAYSTTANLTVNRTTWDGTAWSNGEPDATTIVIFTGNKTITTNLSACSCQVSGTSQVVVSSGVNIDVAGVVSVDANASLTLQNNANLVQHANVQNSGNIVVTKTTAPLFRLDYDFWSSPVSGTQNLQAFSPATTSNRFYTYNTATNLFNVIASPSTTTFATGKGYLIRMPNNWVAYSATATGARWTGSFVGVPNNGDITVAITDNGEGYRYNAIGNPYPSAIDISDFIENNANSIEGTLWFWRKTNDASNPLSYSTCTATGCTLNNNFTIYSDDTVVTSGQGFVVNAKPNQTSVVFKNSMRRANNTDEFFKTTTTTKDRYWLDVKNSSNNSFSQVLIAHLPNATTAYDNGYDGLYINDSQTVLSAIVDSHEVVIDALPSFDALTIIPLQFRTDTADTYTIQLNKTDGIFKNDQTVYLRDNTTGTIQDLKAGSFTFTVDPGTYSGRFDILYATPLSTNQQSINADEVVVYKKESLLNVKSETLTLENVKIFDINGRLVVEKNKINNNQVSFDMSSYANQMMLVQITTDNGARITKKILN